MLDRQWYYPLEYASDLYVRAKKECMDGFIYEARSLYTLLITKLQSYTFTFDEVEDHIHILKAKIELISSLRAISCEEYLCLINQIKTEVNEIKQKEAKQ